MFTGIIEETGTVACLERRSGGACLDLRGQEVLSDLKVGDSIAVNGVCLTTTAVSTEIFRADLSPETLERSTLGGLRVGDLVNLERPLMPTDRLGGHFVQGHVDAVGTLVSLGSLADGNWWLTVDVPEELLRYLVLKGSVAIDGISLTVASLKSNLLEVAIIPHTYERTNLARMSPGAKVNLECDVIAKYVERLLEFVDDLPKSSFHIEDLREQGY
jgi:riboflavin synthase